MLIGREREIRDLQRAYDFDESKFVAIFGRRRVGKTYLVREVFDGKFAFTFSGMANTSTKEQLLRFHLTLKDYGLSESACPANWITAFHLLEQYLKGLPDGKKVVFLDELPWMDSPKSGFLAAFEYFWNAWASARKDILLIVCGSATSWMVNNILRNRGGLHNRLNEQIHLQPFDLHECEIYCKSTGIPMERTEIVEAYMVFGGIPYYWSMLDSSLSLPQNIDSMFFGRNPKLKNEFSDLYASLFKQPDIYINIITALAKKKVGMTREEIVENAKISSSGLLTRYLEDLENCGFIRRYQAIGSKRKGAIFQLIDNYTLFYFKFIEPRKITDANYWSKIQTASLYHTWTGLAFERVCLLHSEQIKKALGISGVITNEYAWSTTATSEHPGVQIDLLIDRSDKIINICEIKYSEEPYLIDKKYMENLQSKVAVFRHLTNTRKRLALTLVCNSGLVKNAYSLNNINSQVTADDLFTEA